MFRERVEWLADDEDVEIPLDKPQARVLCTMSSVVTRNSVYSRSVGGRQESVKARWCC